MSLSKRKFYRTVVQIEILSEEPYSSTDLEKINYDITEGHNVGDVTITTDSEIMDVKTCVERLFAVGSGPEFFCLNKHGHDTEDAEDYLNDDDEEKVKVKKMKD
ncbi:MAG TPA: hypothetical protein VIH28_06910 [Ignavibacteriaceae bacterium]